MRLELSISSPCTGTKWERQEPARWQLAENKVPRAQIFYFTVAMSSIELRHHNNVHG